MPGKARADSAAREAEPWHVRLRLKPLEGWLTTGEVAGFLGISREAVHRLVQRGTLKARTVGQRPVIVIRVKDVEKLEMSPQRRRELEKRAAAAEEVVAEEAAELGDELPEG